MDANRRNQLAFHWIARRLMRGDELGSLGCIAEGSGVISTIEYRCFLRELYNEMKSRGYQLLADHQFPDDPLSETRRDEIAWTLLIGLKYTQGITIDPGIRRRVGNEAAFLNISTDEAMAFAQEVAQAVLNKTFAR
jgi:hypothetical protein